MRLKLYLRSTRVGFGLLRHQNANVQELCETVSANFWGAMARSGNFAHSAGDRRLELAITWLAHYPQGMPDAIDITRERFNRLDAKLDLILEGVHNLQVRVTSIEENMGAMNRRLDSMDRRLERIEKRLDLVEA